MVTIKSCRQGGVRGEVAPFLAPLAHSLTQRVLDCDPVRLQALMDAHGSPVHLMFPQIFEENLYRFRRVYAAADIRGDVLYAMKVNRCNSFLKALAVNGAGADVSSLFELQDALAAGVEGDACSLSGAFKSPDFVELGVKKGAVVAIDSAEEFEGLQALLLASHKGGKTRIKLRWNGDVGASRFGMNSETLRTLADTLQPFQDRLELEGVALHLGGYSIRQRAEALAVSIEMIRYIRELGFDARSVNIGGGFPTRYLSRSNWEAFQGYNGSHYYTDGHPPSDFYPYWSPRVKEEALEDILAACGNRERLRQESVALYVEPGRALVDQAGMTLFRVKGVKRLGPDKHVIVVDGFSFSACETWFHSEFLVDPIVIGAGQGGAGVAYIAGGSCLESDVLTKRWIPFKNLPQAGDCLAFVNTAGYQMDLMETCFHRAPTPKKLALIATDAHEGGHGDWSWRLDESF
ncbi:Diaminopimelate decarboxylase [Hahella chejuensis KCTC 2396]|uniref:Diaminopimelate decarboxylase n=1 Tax=Hahella chejuensis (strain KCTC 2396) TaxID=349521 RepID=Q2SFZ2_HAHCH|nr:Y4yA family PLP-dependent enzyme [Hahella chejuensis]ABC30432.1 Diaminopimelate decarboxylase [Hahella chejuensis KCTC 2396]